MVTRTVSTSNEPVPIIVQRGMLLKGASMAISNEFLDEILKGYKGPEDITGPDGLL